MVERKQAYADPDWNAGRKVEDHEEDVGQRWFVPSIRVRDFVYQHQKVEGR